MGQEIIQGVGLGLRAPHYQDALRSEYRVPWYEAVSENYFFAGGKSLYYLEKIREKHPIVMHGVGMSLGSSQGVQKDYLLQLKKLKNRFAPQWFSDHLCWTSSTEQQIHDLLPMPFTKETVDHFVREISKTQDFLGERILVENISSYLEFTESEMTEWEFVKTICEKADCYLLLDINNIYVNSHNHNFNPYEYINAIPQNRVKQMHLAGYTDTGETLVDTHGSFVSDPVWTLYKKSIEHFGNIPTIIEWDVDIPAFPVLVNESKKATRLYQKDSPHVDR